MLATVVWCVLVTRTYFHVISRKLAIAGVTTVVESLLHLAGQLQRA